MKGFSLIEMIVVLAIISIVGSVSVVTYNTLRKVGDVRHSSYVYVDALKEASLKARTMENDTDWGVKITATSTIVFSGSSYLSRVIINDKVYDSPDNITTVGLTEIVFSKFTGLPTSFGTTTFSNDFGTSSAYVLSSGAIGY